MTKETMSLSFERYANETELPETDRMLIAKARLATSNSHSPYSGFKVGAAVLLANGKIIEGCNIENSAFPSGLCAERVALFAAMAEFPSVPVDTIALTAKAEETVSDPVMPCGACCQVMIDIEKRFKTPIRIVCQGESGEVLVFPSASTLLPFSFDEKYL